MEVQFKADLDLPRKDLIRTDKDPIITVQDW